MHAPFTTTAPNLQGPRRAGIAESDDAYPGILLNGHWRVIECRDGVQWILQYRNRAETVSKSDWRGRSYCRTQEALIGCCDRFCGVIDPAGRAVLEALPQYIGGVIGTAAAVPTPGRPDKIVAPRKVLDRQLPEPRGAGLSIRCRRHSSRRRHSVLHATLVARSCSRPARSRPAN